MDTACFSSEQIEVRLIARCALFVVDVAAAASAAASVTLTVVLVLLCFMHRLVFCLRTCASHQPHLCIACLNHIVQLRDAIRKFADKELAPHAAVRCRSPDDLF